MTKASTWTRLFRPLSFRHAGRTAIAAIPSIKKSAQNIRCRALHRMLRWVIWSLCEAGKPWYAIIGDLGSNRKLGEASVGLLMQAAGWNTPPAYLRASLDRLEQFDVVIFKNAVYGKPLTVANVPDMANVAEDTFRHWGGDLAGAEQRLAVCGRIVSPPKSRRSRRSGK